MEADGTKLTVDQRKQLQGIEDQANRDLPLSEYEARAIRHKLLSMILSLIKFLTV